MSKITPSPHIKGCLYYKLCNNALLGCYLPELCLSTFGEDCLFYKVCMEGILFKRIEESFYSHPYCFAPKKLVNLFSKC